MSPRAVARADPRALAAVREAMDIFPPTLCKAVLADFIDQGHFARHVRRMRQLYRERRSVLVPAHNLGDPAATSGERGGCADEAGADDRQTHVCPGRQTARMSSATRKARSSDWRPLRRGSHSVS